MFTNFYLNIQLLSEFAKEPIRGTKESAGLDFYTPTYIEIEPRKDILIPLDIRIEMPDGFVMILKEKSGVATKKKLDIGASVIDSDYRGNIHCHLINNSDESVYFEVGEKICQGLVIPIWTGLPTIKKSISGITERGEGGFGSTGN